MELDAMYQASQMIQRLQREGRRRWLHRKIMCQRSGDKRLTLNTKLNVDSRRFDLTKI